VIPPFFLRGPCERIVRLAERHVFEDSRLLLGRRRKDYVGRAE